jgi:hypothetical protein|tara:strand:- start:81 stop:410 length:330 start_codon:yes stop_codon:yes gene_type:complete
MYTYCPLTDNKNNDRILVTKGTNMTTRIAYKNGERIYLDHHDYQPYLDGKPLRLLTTCLHSEYGKCWIYDEGQIARFIDAKKDNKKQGYVKIYMPFAQPMTNNDNKKEK